MAYYQLPVQAGGLGADAVCGMDFYQLNPETCLFYDAWAARDIAGVPFAHIPPYMAEGEEEYVQKKPFQVFSCWNGMVAFSADLFQVQQLLFRRNRAELGECAAGEAELLLRDMWKLGRGRILISPQSATSYKAKDFQNADEIEYSTAPAEVACCPLREHAMAVNWTDC